MPSCSDIRDWVAARPSRSFFQTQDVPGSPRAAETTLSRMAADTDGPIFRVRNGLYWVKPAPTRFGTGQPDSATAAMAVAGPGAGPAGWSASQALGLSTQVPVVPTIAVLGRPPKGIPSVRFVSRSNLDRRDLAPIEIAALEVLRDFPDHTGVGVGWSDVRARLDRLAADGRINMDRLLAAARRERKAEVRDRADLLAAA
jgi:hypothetical protein